MIITHNFRDWLDRCECPGCLNARMLEASCDRIARGEGFTHRNSEQFYPENFYKNGHSCPHVEEIKYELKSASEETLP